MKMELMGKLGKYDKEEWILFDYAQKQFEKLGDAQKKEDLDIERYGFSEEGDWVGEHASNMVLDDINTMKILQTLQTEYFYANVATKVVTDFELNCSKNKYY